MMGTVANLGPYHLSGAGPGPTIPYHTLLQSFYVGYRVPRLRSTFMSLGGTLN